MNTLLLLLIFAGLVGLLLVLFYMLDRVNELHKHSSASLTGHAPVKPDQSFGGLSGKHLWDAMTGVPMPGWSKNQLEALKLRYEAVLQKHIEILFEDGQLDGREGFSMPVRCERLIPTLRGEIESWMPHEYATVVYRSGHEQATRPEEERASIRERLDQVGAALFAATGLPPHSLANLLMPAAAAPAPDPAPQNAIPEEAAALSLAAPVDEQAPFLTGGEPALSLATEPVLVESGPAEGSPAVLAPAANSTETPAQATKA